MPQSQLQPAPSGLTALIHPGRPARAELERLRAQGATSDLSYDAVGATIDGLIPEGFRPSGREECLGSGDDTWQRACQAVDRWAMFGMPWIDMPPPGAPRVDQDVVFASRQLGFWSLHSCRVVALVDEAARYGFAYGTLRTHAISGEELFLVERRGDDVWFVIRKFARPNHLLIHLALPFSIWMQGQFDRGAMACMKAAVDAPGRAP